MNKRILSGALALAMVASMGVTAFAIDVTTPGTVGTTVTYSGTATDSYTVSIPATMSAGDEVAVEATGTWASNKKLVVTADDVVVLHSEIDNNVTKELAVTFDGIEQVGNNKAESTASAKVSIADMTGVALGNWSGEFEFTVSLENVTELSTFTVDGNGPSAGNTYQFVEGMTWGEWVDTQYNTEVDVGLGVMVKYRADSNVGISSYLLYKNGQPVLADDVIESTTYTVVND